MSENIFGLDALLKNDEKKLIRYSVRMFNKDWNRLINFRRHKVVIEGDRKYNNTTAVEEAVDLLKEKYDIPAQQEKTSLLSGRRSKDSNLTSKDTSIMLKQDTIDYIKNFLAYKTFVEGNLEYTRMMFFEEILDLLEAKYNLTNGG